MEPVTLLGMPSMEGLQDFPCKTGDVDGKVTYHEIWDSLGSSRPGAETEVEKQGTPS